MDNELAMKNLRVIMENNLQETEQRLALSRVEKAAKQRALAIAEAGALRAGRYKARDDHGKPIDFGAAGKNQLTRQLAQLDFDIELGELMAEELRRQIEQLPDVGDETDDEPALVVPFPSERASEG